MQKPSSSTTAAAKKHPSKKVPASVPILNPEQPSEVIVEPRGSKTEDEPPPGPHKHHKKKHPHHKLKTEKVDVDSIPVDAPNVVIIDKSGLAKLASATPASSTAPTKFSSKESVNSVKNAEPPPGPTRRGGFDVGHHKTRVVMINYKQREKFINNNVKTSKYSIFTFFPYFLYEQFRRFSNIFFLITACLQQIDGVSPTGRWTTLIPLSIILCVSAIKEAVEDRKRHAADTKTNNSDVQVLVNGQFVPAKWKDVGVGDFVRLESEKFVPADVVLYSSSEPLGMCYIETANLDGETNLKLRQALPQTAAITEVQDFANIKGYIECGIPNRHIYEFAGSIHLESNTTELAIGPDQLLLRGAKLRNTKWVVGQVIYSGHDTKLMKNSTKAPLKRSTLEKATNIQIIILLIVLIFISALSWLFSYNAREDGNIGYYVEDNPNQSFLEFFTFVILYNNLIPISLSVTLEVVRFVQALFINWDKDMYHKESDTYAQARTSNLNEELGQIRYIFSDKTGTLTRNVMEFKGCTVEGTLYKYEDLFPNEAAGNGQTDDLAANPLLKQVKSSTMVQEFLIALAVCHYVIPEDKKDENGKSQLVYNAASPDEKALVEGAQKFGYVFLKRTPTSVEISAGGQIQKYEILNLIEFTSTRKRMTVIARCPDGQIRLYCKGADSVILERIAKNKATENMLNLTQEHLDYFAATGLRTLCFAMKVMSQKEHHDWNVQFQKAANAIVGREDEVNSAAELVEKDLTLIGSTAIEDKLQDFVPETIASLMEAGISVWVLTGDKQETAINIGNSCRLITPAMTLLVINQNSEEHTAECIEAFATEMNLNLGAMKGRSTYENIQAIDAVVVIDGKTLTYALSDLLRHDFIALCCNCKAVIVCRAAPIQKAEIVEYVTKVTGAVSLAIGDGANDVAMIQKAHVGVGISGNEGLQAACASDYALAQFSHLKKLVLVHGAWNHDRITKAIFYSFYKNVCLYIIELWFAMYNSWSGQIIFDRWAITTYNLCFACMQPLAVGIFEKNCSMELRLRYPKLYHTTSHGAFSVKNFGIWLSTSLLHSICLFWLTKAIFDGPIWESGKEGSYLVLGTCIYTYVVLVVSYKIGLETKSWTRFTHISIWGSIALWLIFLALYSYLYPVPPHLIGYDVVDMAQQVYSSPVFWICLFLIPAFTLLPDVIFLSIKDSFFKRLPDVYREQEILALRQANAKKTVRIEAPDASSSVARKKTAINILGRKSTAQLTKPDSKKSQQGLLSAAASSSNAIKVKKGATHKQSSSSVEEEAPPSFESAGPIVFTYIPLKKNISKKNLGGMSNEVDAFDPMVHHTVKTPMVHPLLPRSMMEEMLQFSPTPKASKAVQTPQKMGKDDEGNNPEEQDDEDNNLFDICSPTITL